VSPVAHHDDVAAAGLDQSDALGHVQGLTDGVTVPRCVRAGCEVHGVGAHAERLFALEDHVEDFPGE
jgi:hypothetical protein